MNETKAMAARHHAAGSVWLPARQQTAFRQLMTAFSYPGRVLPLAGDGESASMLVVATLIDGACSLADPNGQLAGDDLRRMGTRMGSVETADFVLASGMRVVNAPPRLGSLENPEQGATIVLAVAALGTGATLSLHGPGINGEQLLHVSGVDPAWWTQRAEWNTHFPLGVDFILVSQHAVAALPRTTRITLKGAH
ncbi:hypothetical protein TMEC54S_00030 [Thauera mechernichensis]